MLNTISYDNHTPRKSPTDNNPIAACVPPHRLPHTNHGCESHKKTLNGKELVEQDTKEWVWSINQELSKNIPATRVGSSAGGGRGKGVDGTIGLDDHDYPSGLFLFYFYSGMPGNVLFNHRLHYQNAAIVLSPRAFLTVPPPLLLFLLLFLFLPLLNPYRPASVSWRAISCPSIMFKSVLTDSSNTRPKILFK